MTFVSKAAIHNGLRVEDRKQFPSWNATLYKISFDRSRYGSFLYFIEQVRAFYGKNIAVGGSTEPVDFIGDDDGWITVHVLAKENVFDFSPNKNVNIEDFIG
jgi:hypothetical protein